MKVTPRTLKGFRDFLPESQRKRNYVLNILKKVFESYGFEPLETPALEYEDILTGKYGDEGDKLMYRFTDNGGRKVAMRYDQTVPLARVVAQYANDLPLPFKRYQIQNVYRADNTQKGRYREFLQVDVDTVGSSSPVADAEIIAVALSSIKSLGFEKFKVYVNDRKVFSQLIEKGFISDAELPEVLRSLDKIKKIEVKGVIQELAVKGFTEERSQAIIENAKTLANDRLFEVRNLIKEFGFDNSNVILDGTLARGLEYYTGLIFEIEIEGYNSGSVAGGGRFDELIGMFSNQQIPAVGFSFGFDRIIEAMDELRLFPDNLDGTKVLVTNSSPKLEKKSIEITSILRRNRVNAQLWLDSNTSLDKQLRYADKKQIPFVLIVGENKLKLKNMRTGEEKEENSIGKIVSILPSIET